MLGCHWTLWVLKFGWTRLNVDHKSWWVLRWVQCLFCHGTLNDQAEERPRCVKCDNLVHLMWKQGKKKSAPIVHTSMSPFYKVFVLLAFVLLLLAWLKPLVVRNNYLNCVNRASGAGESQVSDSEWGVMALTYYSVWVQLEEQQLSQRRKRAVCLSAGSFLPNWAEWWFQK